MSKSLPAFKPIRTDDERREHPYCQDCKVQCASIGKDWSKVTSKCSGIYSEEDFEILAERAGLDIEKVRQLYDPTDWIHKNLGLVPFWYQDRAIRCTSARKMLRWGRRTGKTQIISAYLLWLAVTNDNYKVLAITPMKSQAKEIFDRLHDFFALAPELNQDTRSKQQPYYEVNFLNGSRIRIFVSGTGSGSNAGTQVRGQEADIIFIDEMDYLDDDAS